MSIFPWRVAPATREQSAATKLAGRAQRATELRNYQTNPDVQALMGERIRRALMVSQWLGIGFCLIFTAVNVQKFVAGGADKSDITWLVAWIYDPMISVILVGILLVEQYVTSHGHELDRRAKAVKWFAFASTLILNCWTGLFPHGLIWWQPENQLPNVTEVAKHAVPPVLAFLVCEASPGIHRLLTRIVSEVYAKGSAGARWETTPETSLETVQAWPETSPAETPETPRETVVGTYSDGTPATWDVSPVATLGDRPGDASRDVSGDASGDASGDVDDQSGAWVAEIEKVLEAATVNVVQRRSSEATRETPETPRETRSETSPETPKRRRRGPVRGRASETPALDDVRSLVRAEGDAVDIDRVIDFFDLQNVSSETRRKLSQKLYKARTTVVAGDTEGTR